MTEWKSSDIPRIESWNLWLINVWPGAAEDGAAVGKLTTAGGDVTGALSWMAIGTGIKIGRGRCTAIGCGTNTGAGTFTAVTT